MEKLLVLCDVATNLNSSRPLSPSKRRKGKRKRNCFNFTTERQIGKTFKKAQRRESFVTPPVSPQALVKKPKFLKEQVSDAVCPLEEDEKDLAFELSNLNEGCFLQGKRPLINDTVLETSKLSATEFKRTLTKPSGKLCGTRQLSSKWNTWPPLKDNCPDSPHSPCSATSISTSSLYSSTPQPSPGPKLSPYTPALSPHQVRDILCGRVSPFHHVVEWKIRQRLSSRTTRSRNEIRNDETLPSSTHIAQFPEITKTKEAEIKGIAPMNGRCPRTQILSVRKYPRTQKLSVKLDAGDLLPTPVFYDVKVAKGLDLVRARLSASS
mmetsp:Transcript_20497/g.28637  ORF Transcript_20497/g.28637 Transcript_20497/m.28637 type:complete len:323 (-) Transcript_20497:601-1569(-)|eukprot:CAMPEP_0184481186 /NCGR_PEP_ID=MMETSP0113_2-20130426/2712_1 /TAXON_ID=91329 /ORGANISM="Norrisiella sphaerica, Strain BC52" /LENGTH=322 /DNA_ID=CAMNT_0026860129 /DNA_START=121 /DNA_END=1089 /DNA_ORIENTATION=+